MYTDVVDTLTIKADTKIVYLIIDGLGGLEINGKGGTELEVAHTPNLDRLAERSACGLLVPIAPGITPGSGPSHLSLFGYNPIDNNIGRGIFSALGVGFKLTKRDIAARINFATIDKDGKLIDRRAGRIKSDENRRLCKKILKGINLGSKVEIFLETEKDHRAALILRGDHLCGDIYDTDPQRIGVKPLEPEEMNEEARFTASIIKEFISQSQNILADEHTANMLLLRGFAKYRPLKSLKERFKISSLAIANYPMYQGLGRLIGMDIYPSQKDISSQFKALKENYHKYDFIYLHVKEADSRGEDGDFDGKVNVLEKVDRLLPQLTDLKPDVLIVTGDHSTPSKLASHSWHTVPVILNSFYIRRDRVDRFDEISCASGSLVNLPAYSLMSLALANALRLTKYGA